MKIQNTVKKIRDNLRHFALALPLGAAVFFGTCQVMEANTTYIGPADGAWSNPANWQGGVVPTSDAPVIDTAGPVIGNSDTLSINGGFYIGAFGGPGSVNQTGGSLTVNNMEPGYGAQGTYTLTNGTLTLVQGGWNLLIGRGGNGRFNLAGGLLNAGQIWEGWSGGTGVFNMTGGTLISRYAGPAFQNTQGEVDFGGGDMYLTGDQTAITNNAWFHVTGTGTCKASYDGTYTHLSYTSASSPAKVVTVNYSTGFSVDTSMDLISGVLPTSSGASVQLATSGGDPTLATLTDGLAPAQILNYDGNQVIGNGVVLTWNMGAPATVYEIKSYSAWENNGRVIQNYTVDVSADGASWQTAVVVAVNQGAAAGGSWPGVEVTVTNSNGSPLANNVQYIRFRFPNQQSDAVGYQEFVVNGVTFGLPSAPVFTAIPQSRTVTNIGNVSAGNVTFTAQASGLPAPVITWRFVDTNSVTNLLSTVGDTLTITNVSAANAGRYYAVASNSEGTTNSPAAQLTVVVPVAVTETDLSFPGSGSFAPLATNDLILGNPGFAALDNNYNGFTYGGWTPANLTDGNLGVIGQANEGGGGPISLMVKGTVVYDLGGTPAGPGYNITGIRSTVWWTGGGRNNQAYTVSYSSDGINYTPFYIVNYNAEQSGGVNASDVSLAIAGLTNGVKYIKFYFPPTQENGAVGYSQLAVFGSPAGIAGPITNVTSSVIGLSFPDHGIFAPLNTNADLILGNAGDASALNYDYNNYNYGGWTPANLTDGDLGLIGLCNEGCGGPISLITGGTVKYDLGNGTHGFGYDITGIRSTVWWTGGGRDNQAYTVSYSLDGVNFTPFATVNYNADQYGAVNGSDVSVPVAGLSNVRSIQFYFPGQENVAVGYSELAVFGQSSAAIVTLVPPTVSGVKEDANGFSFSISGPNGQPYSVLSTTNMALPLSQWKTNSTGLLTGVGSPIGFTNSTPTQPHQFYRVRSP